MNKMDKMADNETTYDLAGQVIGLAMKVHSVLGPGFQENVYKNALAIELRRSGLEHEAEVEIRVMYENEIVGFFKADLVIRRVLLVELKAIQGLTKADEVQLVNYLTATGIEEGLLLNFGAQRLDFRKKFKTYQSSEPPDLQKS
jgi:GxxExxY protein